MIENADILLMQLEIPMETVEYVAELAYRKGTKVILNPAPAAFLSNKLLECLYAIVPNETEAEMLSGIKVSDWQSARQAADIIAAKGVDIVVITLGSKGALIKEGNEYYNIEAEKIDAIDTTAAGDTFCGALSVGISEGMTIVEAVKMANRAAGITITREGAQAAIPYRKELALEELKI
ncbi:Ribokinase [bioreactor metagenome]|uniref:Ribokinase n=1 Tax=bioreactor metagenome TaxID=1076179 RepID=A0A645HP88_9ZZZZ